ncbi:MAG: hypothetical protein Q7V62_05835 [Actinomycetota bacterium]|nr:hypothetical protein [Actinomycetota bacterium]
MPVCGAKRPSAHVAHALEPEVDAYVPSGHATHALLSGRVPAAQVAHPLAEKPAVHVCPAVQVEHSTHVDPKAVALAHRVHVSSESERTTPVGHAFGTQCRVPPAVLA